MVTRTILLLFFEHAVHIFFEINSFKKKRLRTAGNHVHVFQDHIEEYFNEIQFRVRTGFMWLMILTSVGILCTGK